MKIAFQVVVFDAADLAAESGFRAGVLGGSTFGSMTLPRRMTSSRP
ncbi:MAG TPA: hypothetical protein VE990_02905 [Acidimicrobiales bacterium]|nr:hypothetical protein [Acidimicrobiales bacterium]